MKRKSVRLIGHLIAIMGAHWKSFSFSFIALLVAVVAVVRPFTSELRVHAGVGGDAKPAIGSPKETKEAIKALRAHGGMILPKRLFVVVGEGSSIYFRDIVGVYEPEVFVYSADSNCRFMSVMRRRIRFAPRSKDLGRCEVVISAHTVDGKQVEKKKVKLVVIPGNAGEGKRFTMLMVGDSLGHQSRFPNEFARLFTRPGNPKVTFVGTHKPAGADIYHEHYGGWGFKYFYTVFGKDPKGYHRDRSPFVFKEPGGEPVFDFRRYLDEDLKGARPDYIHIQLGTNDGFALDPDGSSLEKELDAILTHADTLIGGMRKVLPHAVISVGTVIQANADDRAFLESYRPYPQFHSEWRWRRVQMKLARKMLEHFEGRSKENILMVPTHLAVDPLDGYSAHLFLPSGVDEKLSNAVHPTPEGERQLAGAIYSVVKAHFHGAL